MNKPDSQSQILYNEICYSGKYDLLKLAKDKMTSNPILKCIVLNGPKWIALYAKENLKNKGVILR